MHSKVTAVESTCYENRLKNKNCLPWYTVEQEVIWIEVFKILHGYYNNVNNIFLLPHINVATRGNK